MLLKDVVEARDVLKRICTKNCKPKLAYTIMKILKETEDSENFYIEKYRAIMDECAQKNEDGSFVQNNGLFVLKDDHKELFDKKMEELCALEIDDINRKIKLSDLDDSLKLSPADMYSLDILIMEE